MEKKTNNGSNVCFGGHPNREIRNSPCIFGLTHFLDMKIAERREVASTGWVSWSWTAILIIMSKIAVIVVVVALLALATAQTPRKPVWPRQFSSPFGFNMGTSIRTRILFFLINSMLTNGWK